MKCALCDHDEADHEDDDGALDACTVEGCDCEMFCVDDDDADDYRSAFDSDNDD